MERFYGLSLELINSLTKYPSILTYHELGERGCVTEKIQVPFVDGTNLYVSEKINGANARVIFSPLNDFIIGSRKELLYAKNDFIPNSALGIVSTLKGWADMSCRGIRKETDREFCVCYFEVFGGNITKHKEYTGSHQIGFRLLDVMTVNLNDVKEMSLEQISGAREDSSRSFQKWLSYSAFCREANGLGVEIPPQLPIGSLPIRVENTLTFLESVLPKTEVALDDKALGHAEGIVVRNISRSIIAKLKFREYRRTIKTT